MKALLFRIYVRAGLDGDSGGLHSKWQRGYRMACGIWYMIKGLQWTPQVGMWGSFEGAWGLI